MSLCSSESVQLSILRWRAARLFVAVSCPAHLSKAQNLVFEGDWISSSTFWSRSARVWTLLLHHPSSAPSKNGHVVARGLSLIDFMVGPAWSRKEHTGLLPVARSSDGELLSDLRCTFCHVVARLSGKAYPAHGVSSQESDLHPLVKTRPVGGCACPWCFPSTKRVSTPEPQWRRHWGRGEGEEGGSGLAPLGVQSPFCHFDKTVPRSPC